MPNTLTNLFKKSLQNIPSINGFLGFAFCAINLLSQVPRWISLPLL